MIQIDEAFKVFRDEIYPHDGDSIMCEIHKDFGGLDGTKHNCLGCNFADATLWIYNRLHNALTSEPASLEEFYFDYLLKLYLLVERVYVVFDIISLPLEYRSRHFSAFQRVHKWANFIKHPKSFLLVHHPQYFMEDDKDAVDVFNRSKFGVVIDQQFVLEHYAGPDNNATLHKLLTNKIDVAVLFPNIVALTTQFCGCVHEFIDVIRNNRVYREVLNTRTTYDNYFVDAIVKVK
jgi:hypothetical protein